MTAAFAAGLLFGAGLILGGMSRPDKVLGFLHILDRWDPSLAVVMAGALAVTVPAFAWARRRGRTLGGAPLDLPVGRAIDRRLIGGSILFGLGWGLVGLCPGPAVLSLGFASAPGLVFVAALVAGQWLAARIGERS